jgi:hypothetical protein
VVVRPAPITHVANLNLHIFRNPRPSLVFTTLRILRHLNVLFTQKSIKCRLGRAKPIQTVSYRLYLLLRILLALSHDSFLVDVNCEVVYVFLFLSVAVSDLIFSLRLSLVQLLAPLLKLLL